jgi:hypothetical protein
VQAILHGEQLLGLGLHHLADRDASPLCYNFSDIVDIYDLVQLVLRLPSITQLVKFTFQSQAFSLLSAARS